MRHAIRRTQIRLRGFLLCKRLGKLARVILLRLLVAERYATAAELALLVLAENLGQRVFILHRAERELKHQYGLRPIGGFIGCCIGRGACG